MIENAFILAAGFGTRLAPLTTFVPKPLFPIVGKPALEIVLESLSRIGVRNFYINAHHLPEKIQKQAQDFCIENVKIEIVLEENKILGTAGGLGNIFAGINKPNETILVHNGDIIENFDIESALNFHRSKDFAATLILTDEPRINSVIVTNEKVRGFGNYNRLKTGAVSRKTYSGVAFLEPEVLATFPTDSFASLIEYIEPWIERNLVGAWLDDGFWHDFGSPGAYLELHRRILYKGIFPHDSAGKKVWIAENARVSSEAKIVGFAAIGKRAEIPAGANICNSVIWDDSILSPQNYFNSIVTPQCVVDVI